MCDKPVDWSKPLMFRGISNRANVRFVCDLKTSSGLMKLLVYTDEDGYEGTCQRHESGQLDSNSISCYDIINAPLVVVHYRNLYTHTLADKIYNTAEEARNHGQLWDTFRATLQFTYEDGKLTKVEIV